MAENKVQDEVDNKVYNATNRDTRIGGEIGAAGGAATGAVAGAVAGPVGAVAGAVIGGVVGGLASAGAVHEVDKVDDDDTITGIGQHTGREARVAANKVDNALPGNKIPGIQTGGHDIDGTPDTRGITEKIADKVTGDRIDDKTGKPVR